jgi:transposase-like protein
MAKKLQFKCPKCGSSELIEFLTGITQRFAVYNIDTQGNMERDLLDTDYSSSGYFRCGNCQFILLDENGRKIQNDQSLVKWLKKHQK